MGQNGWGQGTKGMGQKGWGKISTLDDNSFQLIEK